MSKNYINDPILTNWELVSVNPKDKNWTWMTVFNIWANSIQSLIGFSLIATLFLVYGLNGWVIFLGTILGGIFTIFIANLVVAALMVLVTFKVEDAGAKGFLLLFLGSWFFVQIFVLEKQRQPMICKGFRGFRSGTI